MKAETLTKLSEQLRELSRSTREFSKTAEKPSEKLDSTHVLNFVRFFGGSREDTQYGS